MSDEIEPDLAKKGSILKIMKKCAFPDLRVIYPHKRIAELEKENKKAQIIILRISEMFHDNDDHPINKLVREYLDNKMDKPND